MKLSDIFWFIGKSIYCYENIGAALGALLIIIFVTIWFLSNQSPAFFILLTVVAVLGVIIYKQSKQL